MKMDSIISKLFCIIEKMDLPCESQHSFDTLSIKLTQNQIPSATIIKNSQQHISLTYTVSLQNMSEKHIDENGQNLAKNKSNLESIDCDDYSIERQSRYDNAQSNDLLQFNNLNEHQNNLFKKKSILKVSNIDFSQFLDGIKGDANIDTNRSKKFIIRGSNSSLISKNKNQCEVTGNSRFLSKSKDKFKDESAQGFTQNLLLRTNKFNAIKNDKIIQPVPLRKKAISFKKSPENRVANASSDRKHTKFPTIKGSSSQTQATTPQRKKALTTHQNLSHSDRNFLQKSERLLVGKTCRISQNDKKAKIYLQKIIQNRNNVIHFNEKHFKFTKDFKENLEQFA